MLFNSFEFLVFFPIVIFMYYLFPATVRKYWLLFASYFFYMCWNAKYALLLFGSTLITYLCGLLIEKTGKSAQKKCWIVLCLTANLGILFFFKYINFCAGLLDRFFSLIHIQIAIPTFDVLLPVGISFYIFQAIGYCVDVYRGDIKAERNFFKYALFVSFFPQLVAGPIERSKNLLHQFDKETKFNPETAKEGLLLMLWGFFLKMVIADRISVFVDTVYGNIGYYEGFYIAFATVLFAFQIYCDFYGYSIIAVGVAKILGFTLMENFNAPYLATSVTDFWRGWHISLTTYFRDYVYIPLGGNRKGKARKFVNKIVVFLLSGLWHGASLSFVVWGGLNGLYQVIGEVLKPVRKKLSEIFKINTMLMAAKAVSWAITFVLVDFTWIFFRAGTLHESFAAIKAMITVNNPWVLFDGSFYEIMDRQNLLLALVCLSVLLFADICKKKGIVIRDIILKQDYWFRWIFIAFAVLVILTFGKYGPAYDAKNFIYFQF